MRSHWQKPYASVISRSAHPTSGRALGIRIFGKQTGKCPTAGTNEPFKCLGKQLKKTKLISLFLGLLFTLPSYFCPGVGNHEFIVFADELIMERKWVCYDVKITRPSNASD